MAQKERNYKIQQILDELKASNGLPENLSTEAQLWDEIFKKETFLMPEQLFPLIKEIYGNSYPKHSPIKPLATEYSVERPDKKKITSVRADVAVLIGEYDIYHFECESKNDKTMVIRMFEYDVHIALSYHTSPMSLQFPHSAVLYLQDNGKIPDFLTCRIHFPDGSSYEYKVPTVKVQTYSLDDIRKKHLSILIPFLPLRFRKYIKPSKNRPKISKDELTSFYQEIILILENEVKNHYLSENNRNIILNLLNKSLIRVFYQDEALLKEVVTLTEPILELEIEKYIYAVDMKINELNKLSEKLTQVNNEIAKKNNELMQKDRELAWKDDEISQKDIKISQKDIEISQKDIEISQKDDEISQKDIEISQKDIEISQKDDELSQKNIEIALLKKQLADLRKSDISS